MADWLFDIVTQLLELSEKDEDLAKRILQAIRKIEQSPARAGKHAVGTRYSYTDSESRFRIGYNFHPEAKEIEIVALHILKREINGK